MGVFYTEIRLPDHADRLGGILANRPGGYRDFPGPGDTFRLGIDRRLCARRILDRRAAVVDKSG